MSATLNDYSKRVRLVNAWLVAGPDAKNSEVAELADASPAYASRIKNELEDELDEDDLTELRESPLLDMFSEMLEESDMEGESEWDTDEQEAPQEEPETKEEVPEEEEPPAAESDPQSEPEQPQQQPAQGQTPQEQQQQPQQPQQPVQGTPQQQPQQQAPSRPSQSQQQSQEPAHAQLTGDTLVVPISAIQELDTFLATIEADAEYAVQNLTPEDGGRQNAFGKLYVAVRARQYLNNIATESQAVDSSKLPGELVEEPPTQ